MDWFSRYWELEPDERREFLEYARDNDEIRSEVEGIEQFEEALRQATRIASDPLSDDALLLYADRDDLDTTDPVIARTLNLIEEAIHGNADAERRYRVLEKRLKHFDSAVPRQGLAALSARMESGRELVDADPDRKTLDATGPRKGSSTSAEPAAPYQSTPGRSTRMRDYRRLAWPLRHVTSSVVTAAAVYLVLFVFSFMVSPRETRLAHLSSDDAAVELLLSSERGDLLHGEIVSSILQAASMLRSAQVSTLGLFPRYDVERLERASVALEELYTTDLPSELVPYVAYFLSKSYLARGDIYNARLVLRSVPDIPDGSINIVVEDLLKRIES